MLLALIVSSASAALGTCQMPTEEIVRVRTALEQREDERRKNRRATPPPFSTDSFHISEALGNLVVISRDDAQEVHFSQPGEEADFFLLSVGMTYNPPSIREETFIIGPDGTVKVRTITRYDVTTRVTTNTEVPCEQALSQIGKLFDYYIR